jgi:hypothetical protein
LRLQTRPGFNQIGITVPLQAQPSPRFLLCPAGPLPVADHCCSLLSHLFVHCFDFSPSAFAFLMHHSQSTILDLDPVPQKHRRKRRGDGADGDQRSAVIPMAYSTALHSVGVELVLHLVLQLYSGQRGSGFSRYDLVRRKAALEKSPGRKPGRQPHASLTLRTSSLRAGRESS